MDLTYTPMLREDFSGIRKNFSKAKRIAPLLGKSFIKMARRHPSSEAIHNGLGDGLPSLPPRAGFGEYVAADPRRQRLQINRVAPRS